MMPRVDQFYRAAEASTDDRPTDRNDPHSEGPERLRRGVIGDETIADAVCDRLVHNAQRIKLAGPSQGAGAASVRPSAARPIRSEKGPTGCLQLAIEKASRTTSRWGSTQPRACASDPRPSADGIEKIEALT